LKLTLKYLIMKRHGKQLPLSKKQVKEIESKPFKEVLAYTRFRDGSLVPTSHPAFSYPRIKRSWSFEGTHEVTLKDGSKETRPGGYIPKMARN